VKDIKVNSDQINRVVVRAPNWVGDAVICLPALRALRRLLPNAHITLVSRPGTGDIFIGADFIDDILIYDRAGLRSASKMVGEWKRRRFDLALLFQNAFEAAAIARFAGVPVRLGYDTDRRGFLLSHPIPSPLWKNERHEIFYYLNLVSELERALFGSVSLQSEPEFVLSISDDRKRRARELLDQHGAEMHRPLVLLCPGSVNSRAKRWPAERYAALADRFSETGASVALIGSPAEVVVSDQVCAHTRRRPLVLTGQTSVSEVAALISIADVLITNDTGPAHIGSAVGTPTVVVFGPTNPVTTRPFGPSGEIIRHPPDCAPCMLRDCPIDHRCMTAINPPEVFERARQVMRQRVEAGV
jgi:lipopolysaccharide heptosyltransferase II